jgi:tRNA(adenine34) deaminase
MSDEHERFMTLALQEARAGQAGGDQPFGAVVVRNGQVVIATHSIKASTFDATAHAETRAVGKATQQLKARWLRDCTFYSTCEPCPMCCGAILNTGIPTLVVGARFADMLDFPSGETFRFFGEYSVERLAQLTGARLHVVSGVLRKECETLYRNARITVNG